MKKQRQASSVGRRGAGVDPESIRLPDARAETGTDQLQMLLPFVRKCGGMVERASCLCEGGHSQLASQP